MGFEHDQSLADLYQSAAETHSWLEDHMEPE